MTDASVLARSVGLSNRFAPFSLAQLLTNCGLPAMGSNRVEPERGNPWRHLKVPDQVFCSGHDGTRTRDLYRVMGF